MTWFARITGFPEGAYAETQARLRVESGRLIPEGGGPGYAVGELELVPLGALRARARDVTVPGRLTLGIVEGDVRRRGAVSIMVVADMIPHPECECSHSSY